MIPAPHSRRLTGWLLDAYPVYDGMAIWILDDEGIRCRLIDPYRPSFYLAGSSTDLAVAGRLLTGQRISYRMNHVQRRELWSADTIPVCDMSIMQPTRFHEAVKVLTAQLSQLRFYHVDVALPQGSSWDERHDLRLPALRTS